MNKLALLVLLEGPVAIQVGSGSWVRHPDVLNCNSSILSVSKVNIFSIRTRVKCSGSGNDRLEILVPPEDVHAFIACARSKRIKGSSIHRDCADLLQVRYCNLGPSRMVSKIQIQFTPLGKAVPVKDIHSNVYNIASSHICLSHPLTRHLREFLGSHQACHMADSIGQSSGSQAGCHHGSKG